MEKNLGEYCENNELVIKYLQVLEQRLKKNRFIHTLGVVETAAKMARHHHLDPVDTMIASALHDYDKNLSAAELLAYAQAHNLPLDDVTRQSVELLHGFVGADMVKDDFNIENSEILDAIRYHTVGRKGMSLMEKIVYLADAIEPGRSDYPELSRLRQLAYDDLDAGVFVSVKETLAYVLERGLYVHPLSVDLYNELLSIRRTNNG